MSVATTTAIKLHLFVEINPVTVIKNTANVPNSSFKASPTHSNQKLSLSSISNPAFSIESIKPSIPYLNLKINWKIKSNKI
jgi:hypothetical protein